jgi:aryl-alcohol dehydrogenase-like predicted oxidoreductase
VSGSLPARSLGRTGLVVSAVGLGCMGLRTARDDAGRRAAQRTMADALELGITMFDTADVYGPYVGEEVVGSFVREHRDEIVLATKFGNVLERIPGEREFDGRPEYVHRALDASLKRLGVDHIDLYYVHRVDPLVPIEDTVGALKELVTAGKIGHIGLSEAGPNTIRRAHAVHPLAAIQTEWSLFSRDIEDDVLPVARELGIGLVPHSPLGRGFLTGAITDQADIPVELNNHPRYAAETFDRNRMLVSTVEESAEQLGVPPAQVALAWLFSRGPDVVPIPGTRRREHMAQNLGALDLGLPPEILTRLEGIAGRVAGARSARPQALGVEAPLRSN